MVCQRLLYSFAHEVLDVFPGGVLLKAGCAPRELTGTIDYTSSEKSSDTGVTRSGTVRARLRKVDALLLSVKDARLVLQLFVGNNSVIVLGSPRYPARLLIDESPPEITMSFSVTET